MVDAAPGQIFALVADPHRHRELDGSGTIRDVAVDGPHELSEGARFSVGMKQFGVPYRITSTVTEFTDGSVIEWQHPLGHRWRWEFADIGAGSTQITEIFDYSTSKAPRLLELIGQPKKNAEGIARTLDGLASRFA